MLLPDLPPSLGMVLEADRGPLPYSLVHGEPLVRCAVLALEEAGVRPIDADTDWDEVRALVDRDAEVLVLHDALCPLTPPDFLAECVGLAAGGDAVVVGFRPVTDTVKHVDGGQVGATVDRASLRGLASPVVLPAEVVLRLDASPGHDLVGLLARLVESGTPLEWVQAPASARRVASPDDVRLLEAATAR